MSTQFLALLKEKAPPQLYRFFGAEISTRASALAFHTLLAIVPAAGLVFWYLKTIGITHSWRIQFETFIASHLTVGSTDTFFKFLEKILVAEEGASLGIVAVCVFAYTALSVLKRLGDSMDAILKTSELEWNFSRSFFRIILRRLLVLVGLPIAIIVSTTIAAWIRDDSWLRPLFYDQPYSSFLTKPIPWIIDGIAFFFLYRFVPRRRISFYEAARAALIIVPLFELAKFGIGAYSVYAISTYKIWGAFSAIPIFFIWLQLAWTILLSGTLFIRNR